MTRSTPAERKRLVESAKQRRRRLKGNIKSTKKKKNSIYYQTDLQGHRVDAEAWGDKMEEPAPRTIRLGFQNIGPQPLSSTEESAIATAQHIHQGFYDAFLFAEHGLHWGCVPPEHHWRERIRHGYESCFTKLGYNVQELASINTPHITGGTGLLFSEELTARRGECGTDNKGLGRRTWCTVRGKRAMTTRIISAYRPNRNKKDYGSVWNQHERYLTNQQDRRDPLQAFDEDLLAMIDQALEAGEHIVLGMDANADVRTVEFSQYLKERGIHEAVLSFHPDKIPPATHQANTHRKPIDSLWISSSLEVVQAGLLAFGDGCPSDHRLVWMDLSLESLLGHRPPRLLKPVAQRLKSKDPRARTKYCANVEEGYQEKNIMSRTAELASAVEHFQIAEWGKEDIIKKYNELQHDIYTIRKKSCKKVRKIARGGVPWSPKLQGFRDCIALWKRVITLGTGKATSRTIIKRLARKCGKRAEVKTASLDQAVEQLKAAYKAYKEAKPKAAEWREGHLVALADAVASEKGTTRHKELKSMRGTEEQRRKGQAARRLRGKAGKTAVIKVIYDDALGNQLEAQDPDTLAEVCATSNLQRQMQCQDTPFMQPPLVNELGYLADSPAADAILDGTYEPSLELDQYTREFLRELKTPEKIRNAKPISIDISPEEQISAWKKQKENVASEPSGLAFSHYKAVLDHPALVQVDATMREIPLKVGFAPELWCRITDVEILKKANVYDVEQMRLIQLMNAEFNMNNKMIGRRMMANAEKHGTIPPDQYGSRKHHRAITAALNKRLTMDLWRFKKQSGGILSVDAKGCYDRVNHSSASLSERRQGVPKSVVLALYAVLQLALHCIASGFGISEPLYGGPCQVPPIQGEGQGNGKGPSDWAVISSVLINMMYRVGHGVKMLTAISVAAIAFVCFAFVDDTDLVHTGSNVDTPSHIIVQDMKEMADRWEGGLRASGGALVPSKSFWYLIDFEWTGNKWIYKKVEDTPGEISIRSPEGPRQTLRRFDVNHAEKTLGVFLSMDGNEAAQYEYLRGKALEFADLLRTQRASKNDIWYALQSSFMKTIEYPTTVTTLSKKQWDSILSPVLQQLLPRTGLARTFPRVVVYGPSEYQGLNLMHPWYNQELTHIQSLLEEIGSQSLTGQLQVANIEELFLELGCAGHLGRQDYKRVEHLVTDSWMKALWRFVSNSDITVEGPWSQLQLLRIHDTFLIPAFVQAGFRGNDLKILNTCRLFLEVVSLADITTSDGRFLTVNALAGIRAPTLRKLQWPRRIPTLSPSFWQLWPTALQKAFLLPYSPNSNRRLRKQLGVWTDQEAVKSWPQWYSPLDERVYKKEGLMWRVYGTGGRVQRSRRRRFCPHNELLLEKPTHASMMASLSTQGETLTLDSILQNGPLYPSAPPAPVPRCSLLVEDDTILIDELSLPQDGGLALAQGIRDGTARMVTDGSSKDAYGTAAGKAFQHRPALCSSQDTK